MKKTKRATKPRVAIRQKNPRTEEIKADVSPSEKAQIKKSAALCGYRHNLAQYIRLIALSQNPEPLPARTDDVVIADLFELRQKVEKELKWRQTTLDRYVDGDQELILEANASLAAVIKEIDAAVRRIGSTE